MFSIKHVTTGDQNEELHMGTSPVYISPTSHEGLERGNPVFHYTDEKGEVQTLRYGKIYVMNEAGRTVASYDLGAPNTGGSYQSGEKYEKYAGYVAL